MANAQYTSDDFLNLHPLEGKWIFKKEKGDIVEVWTKADNLTLIGESYFLKGGEKIPGESIKLYHADGEIFYIPTVFDQNEGKPITFKLVEIKGNEFTFENKEHDFPQRIIYNMKSDNEVDAAVEGDTDKGFRRVEFSYKREK